NSPEFSLPLSVLFNDTLAPSACTLSLHDALPISSLLGWVPSAAASASTGSRGRGAVSPPPAAGGVAGGGGTGVVGGGAWNTYGGPVVVAALFGTTMRSICLTLLSSVANRPVCASRNTTPLRSWTTVNTCPGLPCREMATTPRVPSGSVDMMSTICP